MIARLRRRHRTMITGVGVLAIVALAAALAARPPRSLSPSDRRAASPDTSAWSDLGDDLGIRALREPRGEGESISLWRPEGLSSPDPLVYWAPDATAGSSLPAGAVLLGPLGDPGVHRYELPAAAPAGSLVVYSLGHDRILVGAELDSIRLADRDTGARGRGDSGPGGQGGQP